jgi:ferritin-like metal-binding protein YciE
VVRTHASSDAAPSGERTVHEQLKKYLTDMHSIELQAAAQLRLAPRMAGDAQIAQAFREHLIETAEHERLIRGALGHRGARPSNRKDLAGRAGGWAMVLFAWLNPDTPGKLVAHAFSYEHMEEAAYELLSRVALRASDQEIVELAGGVAGQERAMADRLARGFDQAVEVSLRQKHADDLESELVSYLRDVHAIESQAQQFLRAAARIAGVASLTEVLRQHLEQTREQSRLVQARLAAHGASPSRLQDVALRVGGVNLSAFFAAQPDTAIKLAGFAYAFEHLEVAAYELLRRVAVHAKDAQTVTTAERILEEEHAAAARVKGTWDDAVNASLSKLGITQP